jgi:hypothetical protein
MIGGLRESLEDTQSLASRLEESGLVSSRYLAEIGAEARERAGTTLALDALQQSDREEEVALWLEERGFEDACRWRRRSPQPAWMHPGWIL